MRLESKGVTAPRGFKASGVASGIKRGKPDLALVFSEKLSVAAGVLTTNRMAAAPVLLARNILRKGYAQAIVANSGNANCCTGPKGMQDARAIREISADLLGIKPERVLVASTGVIGRFLPTRRIVKALPALVNRLGSRGNSLAARAILTTDLVVKSVSIITKIQGRRVAIGGIAKGSGMIDPAMATMLCFLTTDAAVDRDSLRLALQEAVRGSFNAITVDGQMSTNDMTLILANGLAGNGRLRPGENGSSSFCPALRQVTSELARRIVKDGEGATRLITVDVRGGSSYEESYRVAKEIANAPLIKTMVAGSDPNWGRVAATVGAAGVNIHPAKLTIGLSGITLFQKGAPVSADRLKLKERFRKPEVSIEVDLGRGGVEARVMTCDLTKEYVKINAKYS